MKDIATLVGSVISFLVPVIYSFLNLNKDVIVMGVLFGVIFFTGMKLGALHNRAELIAKGWSPKKAFRKKVKSELI